MTCLVSEFIQYGALYDILHSKEERMELSWFLMAKFVKDAASALSYLHQFEPPLIHRDVKSSNLLLVSLDESEAVECNVKLCDFGTAREVSTNMTGSQGTTLWMSPEVFCGTSYSIKADIWGLGIVIGEMATRKPPWSEISYWDALVKVKEGEAPPIEEEKTPPIIFSLWRQCLSKDPSKRPFAGDIGRIISDNLFILKESGGTVK